MRTVFDLVGVFRHVVRAREGAEPVITTERKVLKSCLECNQAAAGKEVLADIVAQAAKQHIRTTGLHRVWIVDWDLVERQVQEQQAA
jgi:hypothetical protein